MKILSFPTFQIKNVRLYYFLTVFMNGWFILPNWVFYFGKFITIVQIGFIDGIGKLAGIVFEIPSGTFSDLLGKRNLLITGNGLIILCCLILIYSSNFIGLLIGNICMFLGFACISGAKEALLYDSLLEARQEEHYDEVLGKVSSIGIVTTILSISIGSFLYGVHSTLPFFAWILFCMVSIGILLGMKEPSVHSNKVDAGAYISTLKSGVRALFTRSFRPFIVTVLFFSMFNKLYEGVVRQNMGAYFGFSGENLGYFISIALVAALVAAYHFKKIKSFFGDKKYEIFVGLMYIGAFSVAFIANNGAGMAVFLFLYIAQELVRPFILSQINRGVDSKHRTTALSTVSLISDIPYLILVIAFGALLEIKNLPYLYGIFIGFLVVFLLFKWGKRERVEI